MLGFILQPNLPFNDCPIELITVHHSIIPITVQTILLDRTHLDRINNRVIMAVYIRSGYEIIEKSNISSIL